MSKIDIKVEEKYEGTKIREYLKYDHNLSSRFIKNASCDGRIKVNSKVVKMNYILRSGDMIEIELNKDEEQDIEPQNIPLDIIYEDSDILVVNKPPYMVVHPTKSHLNGTLANGLLYHFKSNGENCIVRLVSRLDMNTSGLIIIAKNQFSHMALSRDMQKEDFKKYYLAVTHGVLKDKNGTIDLPIYRPGEGSIKRIVDDRGQRSITHYKTLKSFKAGELLELELETGRTHQIRVHLSHIGHPIYGDSLYGVEGDEKLIERQALHAYKLEFPHPRTGENMVMQCELPEDIKSLIEKL